MNTSDSNNIKNEYDFENNVGSFGCIFCGYNSFKDEETKAHSICIRIMENKTKHKKLSGRLNMAYTKQGIDVNQNIVKGKDGLTDILGTMKNYHFHISYVVHQIKQLIEKYQELQKDIPDLDNQINLEADTHRISFFGSKKLIQKMVTSKIIELEKYDDDDDGTWFEDDDPIGEEYISNNVSDSENDLEYNLDKMLFCKFCHSSLRGKETRSHRRCRNIMNNKTKHTELGGSLHMPYFKQGDDLVANIIIRENGRIDKIKTFESYQKQIEGGVELVDRFIKQYEELQKTYQDIDEKIKFDADTHMIFFYGDKLIMLEFIKNGILSLDEIDETNW